jgi:hemerythrin superfamily protein
VCESILSGVRRSPVEYMIRWTRGVLSLRQVATVAYRANYPKHFLRPIMSHSFTSTSYPEGRDLGSIVIEDHKVVNRFFDEYNSTTNSDKRQQIIYNIIREVCMHSNAEVLVMYPLLKERGIPGGEMLNNRAIEETRQVEQHLYELESMRPEDPATNEKIKTIHTELNRHIREEEEEIIPKLRSQLSAEEMVKLGETFLSRKAMAPTRPHPSAPKEGVAATAAAIASKGIDEMKDTARFGFQRPPVDHGTRGQQ